MDFKDLQSWTSERAQVSAIIDYCECIRAYAYVSGSWAIDMATEFADAEVLGIDLVPPNPAT